MFHHSLLPYTLIYWAYNDNIERWLTQLWMSGQRTQALPLSLTLCVTELHWLLKRLEFDKA